MSTMYGSSTLNDYGPETIHGSINQDDFQADLVSSGKFYQNTTLFAIEDLIKDCIALLHD
jgi:hypothetical protein